MTITIRFEYRFLTGIKVKDEALFTSRLENKHIFSNMPTQSLYGSYGVLIVWQYVDVTVI